MTPRAGLGPSPCDGCPTAVDCPREPAQVARCAETLRRAGQGGPCPRCGGDPAIATGAAAIGTRGCICGAVRVPRELAEHLWDSGQCHRRDSRGDCVPGCVRCAQERFAQEKAGAPSDSERGAPSGAEPRSDLGTAAQAPLRAAGSEATTDPEERVHVYTQRRDAEHCGTSTPRAPSPPPERSATEAPGGGCCGTVLARVHGQLLEVGGLRRCQVVVSTAGGRRAHLPVAPAAAQALAAHLYERVEITVRLAPEEG